MVPLTPFQYKNQYGTWLDVPDHARPEEEDGFAAVVYPEPADVTCDGYPCGAFGPLKIVISGSTMRSGKPGEASPTGLRWWMEFFRSGGVISPSTLFATINGISAYDRRQGIYRGFSGVIHAPKVGNMVDHFGEFVVQNVTIEIDHLVEDLTYQWP